ncbi:MAG: hypothetical protein LBG57_14060 [Treponema sp.]|jgi:hypothetical protein|nr:hypothetical protein [Treponema sp.]
MKELHRLSLKRVAVNDLPVGTTTREQKAHKGVLMKKNRLQFFGIAVLIAAISFSMAGCPTGGGGGGGGGSDGNKFDRSTLTGTKWECYFEEPVEVEDGSFSIPNGLSAGITGTFAFTTATEGMLSFEITKWIGPWYQLGEMAEKIQGGFEEGASEEGGPFNYTYDPELHTLTALEGGSIKPDTITIDVANGKFDVLESDGVTIRTFVYKK